MKIKSKWLPVVLLIVASCVGRNNQNNRKEEINFDDTRETQIFQIDPRTFEENELTVADFAADIEYIPLSNAIKIGFVTALKITCEAIYLVSDESSGGEGEGHQVLIRFNSDGQDPIQIGRIGKGPGEYLTSANFTVDEQHSRVYINGKLNTIMVFDTKGRYIREFKFQDPDIRFSQIELLTAAYLFVPERSLGAKSQHLWTIIDTLGNIVSVKNSSTPHFETRIGARGGTCSFNGNISCWVDYNDTIFTIFPDFGYKASFIMTPGEHRKPQEDIPLSLDLPIRLLEYYSPHYFFETNRYLISRYNYKGKFGYMFLDKAAQKISICYFDVKKDERGGIVNNIDGGLEFSPEAYFTKGRDEYLAGLIHPFKLKAYIASNAFKRSTPSSAERKKELEQLANSLDENDNPVLMLVKLKN
ncbi:MAG: 6-bladed beta-propeller [Bacteroidales bacterium]|nr:6-bladed beta-propeller [Bacteroidales bacterium]